MKNCLTLWIVASLCLSCSKANQLDLPSKLASSKISSSPESEIKFQRLSGEYKFEGKFSKLPDAGKASHPYWSDSTWPNFLGGIAWRWNDPNNGKNLMEREPITMAQVKSMTLEERKKLSPAEKYDAYMGWLGLGGTDWTMRQIFEQEEPWAGICDGWTSAVINFPEPAPITLEGPGGIVIPFGSSDVKALLSFHMKSGVALGEMGMEKGFESPDFDLAIETQNKLMISIGNDCNEDQEKNSCDDVTPKMFHLSLGNLIGIQGDGFGIDVNSDFRKYFQPVYSYELKKTEIKRSPLETVYAIEASVTTAVDLTEKFELEEMDFSNPEHFEFSMPSFFPRISTGTNRLQTLKYQYELTVDAGDTIVDGRWISKNRPDIIFKQKKIHEWKGHFSGLKQIYRVAP
jgi:hypothetical protein